MKRRGFTLLEIMLYLAVAGAVAVVLVQSIQLVGSIRNRFLTAAIVDRQADWAMTTLVSALESADVAEPDSGASATALLLTDGRSFVVSDGVLYAQTATRSDALTDDDVVVAGLLVENLGTGGTDTIRVTFSMSFAADASVSEEFRYARTYVTSTTRPQ
ncbi:MAG TPA: prepilin-type N-terminal cleavage/methylation domain-containing protein [Candidatus Paceibacterota bacterium]|nr:prepilin-type N-terminal cleavage/methylation domain-containing protein [Candidatus Paceibacterota bacterium]